VWPLHPVCGHGQAISGVFAVASHSVLQYLPDVVTHEQTGCAHFSVFVGAISFLPTFDQEWKMQTQNISLRGKVFLYTNEHIAMSFFLATVLNRRSQELFVRNR
jgi:hypothetical protein